MDDFSGLLVHDFGFKPQSKSSSMVPPPSGAGVRRSADLGVESGGLGHDNSFSDSLHVTSNWDGDKDEVFFNDVFGGPPKHVEAPGLNSDFEYESAFKENSKSALPVFDKPVYDDDIFDGVPGLKHFSNPSVKFDDDVFSSTGVDSVKKGEKASDIDDLLGNFGNLNREGTSDTLKVENGSPFDDFITGLGSVRSTGVNKSASGSGYAKFQSQAVNVEIPNALDDPFAAFEARSHMVVSSSKVPEDPLEEITKLNNSGARKFSSSLSRERTEDLDHQIKNNIHLFSSEFSNLDEDLNSLRTESGSSSGHPHTSMESAESCYIENEKFQGSHGSVFDVPAPSAPEEPLSMSHSNVRASETVFSPTSEDRYSVSNDEVWLSVSEIPLFTECTKAPPPLRPPPPKPAFLSKQESRGMTHSRSNVVGSADECLVTSQIDELEAFAALGQNQQDITGQQHGVSGDFTKSNSHAAASAAAVKDAMDKAEVAFRQMRGRDYTKSYRSNEAPRQVKNGEETHWKELNGREAPFCDVQDAESELVEIERAVEEKEREKKRVERERARKMEIERARQAEVEREQARQAEVERERARQTEVERERARQVEVERERARQAEMERERARQAEMERERARQAEIERERARHIVEKATREARERAAAEARLKAERAAAEKAASEARERAERAAVHKAQAEARERAAAEARERAKKASMEARERANAEARDARLRSERAAVERVAAEVRERAAAEARERAAAARLNQQKNENNLDSFFSSQPNAAQRPRARSPDLFDSQNKEGSQPNRTSAGASSNLRKASSATNIVDDLSSIFGANTSHERFEEIDGESEDRRKARLERHQRTQERAAKALAEKNERDIQAQKNQEERHRIAETVDIEIKRWAAGKEGNLRALLSTLQYVLWVECGWQPVSLTDLITAASVKKVYRKATLCIHPDKVQQKGATLQQKYVAEKVFDLLKEAWNKFNSEELF